MGNNNSTVATIAIETKHRENKGTFLKQSRKMLKKR